MVRLRRLLLGRREEQQAHVSVAGSQPAAAQHERLLAEREELARSQVGVGRQQQANRSRNDHAKNSRLFPAHTMNNKLGGNIAKYLTNANDFLVYQFAIPSFVQVETRAVVDYLNTQETTGHPNAAPHQRLVFEQHEQGG